MLGKGAFGSVHVDKNSPDQAVKSFKNVDHLVAEAFSTRYVSGPYTIKLLSCHFRNKTMTTQRWNTSLENVLSKEFLTLSQKEKIHRCILQGLAHLESLKMVHADLKPSNILVNADRTEAVLADFGLSSKSNSAKVMQTAMAFSPKDVTKSHRSHDLFSFVIITLQIFYSYQIRRVIGSRAELRDVIRSVVPQGLLLDVLLHLIPDNVIDCWSAEKALRKLYNIKLPRVVNKLIHHDSICEETKIFVEKSVSDLQDKYHFRKGANCIQAMISLLSKVNIPEEKVFLYVSTMCYIFSCLFGRSKKMKLEDRISLDSLKRLNRCNEDTIYFCIMTILKTKEAIAVMFM